MQIITLNITCTNPIEASQWVNHLLSLLNETLWEGTISPSNRRVTHLHAEIEKVKIVNVREMLFVLLENEL